jgi:hypothetical protein
LELKMKHLAVFGFVLYALAAEDRGIGVWEFVLEKSTYESGPAPKQSQRQWIADGDWVRFVHDGVGADGKKFHTEFRAKYDGKPVPFVGGTRYDAVALKLVSPNVVEQTFTLQGKVTVEATRTIAADGRTMTIVARGKNEDGRPFRNVLIYRRK